MPNQVVAAGPKIASQRCGEQLHWISSQCGSYLHRTKPCAQCVQSRASGDRGGQQPAGPGHRRTQTTPIVCQTGEFRGVRGVRCTALVTLAVRMGLLANLLWYLRLSQNLVSIAQQGILTSATWCELMENAKEYKAETKKKRDDDSIKSFNRILESGARPSLKCGVELAIKEFPTGKCTRLSDEFTSLCPKSFYSQSAFYSHTAELCFKFHQNHAF